MAKFGTQGRSLVLAIIATFLSLATVVLAIIVVVAGVKPGALDDLALFKVRERNLDCHTDTETNVSA